MTCGRCRRPISKRDVEAGRYVRSAFTRLHYCIRRDCRTVDPAMKQRGWDGTKRDDLK